MINYYTAWIDEELLLTILRIPSLKNFHMDLKILIIDKIMDYLINKEIADIYAYEYWDDNFHTGYPDYDTDYYYSD